MAVSKGLQVLSPSHSRGLVLNVPWRSTLRERVLSNVTDLMTIQISDCSMI